MLVCCYRYRTPPMAGKEIDVPVTSGGIRLGILPTLESKTGFVFVGSLRMGEDMGDIAKLR
jgi:hypothetical protein